MIEKNGATEKICGFASDSFKNAKLNYPSSHKEILAIEKAVNHFKLFLKPMQFPIRTSLKIMPGIFKNENLMAKK